MEGWLGQSLWFEEGMAAKRVTLHTHTHTRMYTHTTLKAANIDALTWYGNELVFFCRQLYVWLITWDYVCPTVIYTSRYSAACKGAVSVCFSYFEQYTGARIVTYSALRFCASTSKYRITSSTAWVQMNKCTAQSNKQKFSVSNALHLIKESRVYSL